MLRKHRRGDNPTANHSLCVTPPVAHGGPRGQHIRGTGAIGGSRDVLVQKGGRGEDKKVTDTPRLPAKEGE